MKHRTSLSLAAALSLAFSGTAALAQSPGPDAPKPPADAPPADKPPSDKPADTPPADKPPADKPPADKPAADKPAGDGAAGNKPEGEKNLEKDTAAKPVEGEDEDANPRRPFVFQQNDFKAWPMVLLQVQASPYVGKDASFLAGDIAERPGFRLRRARFGAGGSYKDMAEMKISGEITMDREALLTLHEAWMGVKPWSWFGASLGILPVPFSRSALISSGDTALIDRPLAARALAPFNQLGAQVGGSVASGRFHYSLGVFNGFARGDQFYTGYQESLAALGNRFENLAYAARVAASLDAKGDDIPRWGDDRNRFNVGASYFFSDGGARDIHAVEGDLFFQRSGIRALAEVIYTTTIPESRPTQPTTQTADINSFAVVAEGGYTFRKLLGAHLRFEWIDPNMAVQDAADNWLLTAGVSFMPPVVGDFVRAQLEFTHREEVHGKSIENDALTLQTQFVLQ